jgi:anion-transporting  ArsA/GET3 family ATPase
VQWEELFTRPVLIVSGKGGTGKSVVAAAAAGKATAAGLRTLLIEVEGRREVTRTLGIPDPGFTEVATAHGFSVLSVSPREAALEYLRLFYGMDRVSRPLLRAGALDQVIGAAPGFRDLLACGKLYEVQEVRRTDPRDRDRPLYDLVIVDAPPTGQIASFLAAPGGFADLARVGRLRRQAVAVERFLRTSAAVLLVAIPEEMAVAETIEAIPAIESTGVPVAAVAANRCQDPVFGRGVGAVGRALGAGDVARVSKEAGLSLSDEQAAFVAEGALAADRRFTLQRGFLKELRRHAPVLRLPEIGTLDPREVVVALSGIMRGDAPPPPTARLVPTSVRHDGPVGHRTMAHRPANLDETDLAGLLSGTRIVVVCGSGGVGKTTVSAALAVLLAERGQRTALLTVDPARRLASALRLPTTPGERTRIRVGGGRSLVAMQLDTQRTFDDLIRRHAGNAERRDRILSNRFYRRIADTLSGTHEYMAMERLYELASDEDHEAIVIDTPPTRSALSFLDAPRRMTDFLGGRFLRWMLWPGARAGKITLGMARFGAAAFGATVGRLIGAEVLADTVEFLAAFEGMYEGFKRRAAAVLELLRSSDCAFVVVTAPTPGSLEEAGYFIDRLRSGGMRAEAVVANRWHADGTVLPEQTEGTIASLLEGGPEERAVASMLADDVRREPLQAAETDAIEAFAHRHDRVPIVAVPELPGDIHDVAGLRRVAAYLGR